MWAVEDDLPVSPQWQKDWRRIGASIMSLGALSAITWASATQSFVVEKGSQLVHPNLWQWPFILCFVVMAAGLYVILTTYHPRLPMFGREHVPEDHSAMYGLALLGSAAGADQSDHPGLMRISAGIVIVNSCSQPISYCIEEMIATFEDQRVDQSDFPVIRGRLLPGHSRSYKSGYLEVPAAQKATIDVSYRISYGPLSGYPRYERTHKIAVDLYDIAFPYRGGNNYRELEEEVDIILPRSGPLPAPAP